MARPRKDDNGDSSSKYAHQDWFHIGNVACSIFGFHKKSGTDLRYAYTITHMYTDSENKRQRSNFFPNGEGLTIRAVVDEAERRIERNKELRQIRDQVHGVQPQAVHDAPPVERTDAPIA